MSGPTDLPLDPALRELGKQVHTTYALAARIARATWPAEETSPEAMVAAAATIFIELSRALGHAPAGPATAPGSPVAAASATGAPPACPKCQRIMVAVVKTSPKQPDWRCPDRACDHALWTKAGARS